MVNQEGRVLTPSETRGDYQATYRVGTDMDAVLVMCIRVNALSRQFARLSRSSSFKLVDVVDLVDLFLVNA